MPRLVKKFFAAKKLRNKGYSLKEISEKIGIAKSTASVWFRDYKLSRVALERLARRGNLGRVRSNETRRKRRLEYERICEGKARKIIRETSINKGHLKIFSILLYWCEGSKNFSHGLEFSNSNPLIVRTYLYCLRKSFSVDEEKFRVAMNLHEYHSVKGQIDYWSGVTGINQSKFFRPYIKPHTGKRKRKDYPGCINIKYYDTALAKELLALGRIVFNKYGGVV